MKKCKKLLKYVLSLRPTNDCIYYTYRGEFYVFVRNVNNKRTYDDFELFKANKLTGKPDFNNPIDHRTFDEIEWSKGNTATDFDLHNYLEQN